MAHGIGISQKGVRINWDEFMMNARRPLVSTSDQKNKITPAKLPVAQLNTRGFVPSSRGVAKPPTLAKANKAVVVDGPSIADFTAITIDNPKNLKQRPVDPMAAASDTLSNIMGELEQYSGSHKQTRKSKA